MGSKTRGLESAIAVFGVLVSGCLGPAPGGGPSPTTTVTPPNACTDVRVPAIDAAAQTVRGANALAYTVDLVCDHRGGSPKERPRVPGTPEHVAAAAHLYEGFRSLGWTVGFQNFTGSEYEAILQANREGSRSYVYYGNEAYCSAEERNRLRGLRFSNVVGTGGTRGAASLMILMAHWDSKRYTQDGTGPVLGANDGASGVGVLLELARVLSRSTHPWEIRMLLTDGEDGFDDCHPLAGSTFYAEQLSAADQQRLRGILLLDMVGDSGATFYRGCGQDEALAARVWGIAERLDVPQFRQEGTCPAILDDHVPFEERGMRAVDVIHYPFPSYWHTNGDTPDKLSAQFMGDVARVVMTLLEELATTPSTSG